MSFTHPYGTIDYYKQDNLGEFFHPGSDGLTKVTLNQMQDVLGSEITPTAIASGDGSSSTFALDNSISEPD